MGQYYMVHNLTKKLRISSHDTKTEGAEWGSGSKLMEHSYIMNDYVGAICELLKSDWAGDKIAWIGDYFETGEIEGIPSWGEADDLGYKEIVVPGKVNNQGFLNNHTKGLSIDMSKLTFLEPDYGEEGWQLHPLSLLTACGNGRGGGDYRGDDIMYREIIGSWAGDAFCFTEDKAKFPCVPFDEYMNDNALKFIRADD
jgi:hypothetical protein